MEMEKLKKKETQKKEISTKESNPNTTSQNSRKDKGTVKPVKREASIKISSRKETKKEKNKNRIQTLREGHIICKFYIKGGAIGDIAGVDGDDCVGDIGGVGCVGGVVACVVGNSFRRGEDGDSSVVKNIDGGDACVDNRFGVIGVYYNDVVVAYVVLSVVLDTGDVGGY
ncbi:Hypothetical predicted protein [Octopus vulgaris]|uniref:Uncharacterized protein n=1 Tax=Octopus vulgaris TaxID=6645 RepID=A0AA36AW79_OCTVU|nr:Hypothetical predicted protein [Octopus vulgaris]